MLFIRDRPDLVEFASLYFCNTSVAQIIRSSLILTNVFSVICPLNVDEILLLQGNMDDFAYFCLERELWKNCFIHYSASVLSCA